VGHLNYKYIGVWLRSTGNIHRMCLQLSDHVFLKCKRSNTNKLYAVVIALALWVGGPSPVDQIRCSQAHPGPPTEPNSRAPSHFKEHRKDTKARVNDRYLNALPSIISSLYGPNA